MRKATILGVDVSCENFLLLIYHNSWIRKPASLTQMTNKFANSHTYIVLISDEIFRVLEIGGVLQFETDAVSSNIV